MDKEKKIQECESKRLLDELSKMPPMVIATAYLHAINYTLYGEDVTEKWVTATQNSCSLEKAYKKGYYDALQKKSDEELNSNELYIFARKLKEHCQDCEGCCFEIASDDITRCRINGLLPCDWEV